MRRRTCLGLFGLLITSLSGLSNAAALAYPTPPVRWIAG